MGDRPLDFGIVGIIGPPGSGKSYSAVREIIRLACTTDRPIYTNIPIRPKKLRAYVMAKLRRKVRDRGERRRRANLVKPINKRHFDRFCNRLATVDALAEEIMEERGIDRHGIGDLAEFQVTECRNAAMAQIAEEEGPPVISGAGANWLPPGAVLFLDELHKWYPSKGYKDEPDEILQFTSMHRHMQLRVFVLSQRWMNVSLSFRAMAAEVWYVMNWSKVPILGFFRLSRWINIFRVVHYNAEDVEERGGLPRIGAKPIWSEMIWPEFEGGNIFRCYRSHSHMGRIEDQKRELATVTAAMLGREAPTETATKKENPKMKKPSLFDRLTRWCGVVGVVCLAFVAGTCAAGGDSEADQAEDPPSQTGAVADGDNQADQAEDSASQPEGVEEAGNGDTERRPSAAVVSQAEGATERRPFRDYRLTGIVGRTYFLNGSSYAIGDFVDGVRIVAVAESAGEVYGVDQDRTVWRWRLGGLPVRGVLPAAILGERVRRSAAGSGAASSGPAVDAAEDGDRSP